MFSCWDNSKLWTELVKISIGVKSWCHMGRVSTEGVLGEVGRKKVHG